MQRKTSSFETQSGDQQLISDLLKWMNKYQADYTNTFFKLTQLKKPNNKIYQNNEFSQWFTKWKNRLKLNKKSTIFNQTDEAV